ncbi:hypothetical protein SZN_27746 [Streptomyces zinciresistens K42]|uniref:Uncharacterized protein n=1 Tax=Streptomyces zinciresistens K42 TaxID=700597 RepID=G2GJ59_9ACTN|nr:hypothetical protein SZN_27746 [Streptomyces zinciresistens K42]
MTREPRGAPDTPGPRGEVAVFPAGGRVAGARGPGGFRTETAGERAAGRVPTILHT